MSGVYAMPAADTLTPEQALAEAAKAGFSDVLIVGYVGEGLFWRTSRLTKAQAVFLLEMAKKHIMEDSL
jgi:hypothetical protein